MPPPPAPL
ncbi:hypothetical protein CP061683_2032, partial [Chlamydia psittaci 06-1683]